jgi:hypothetical protein
MTDDEMIATALLHGLDFHHEYHADDTPGLWYWRYQGLNPGWAAIERENRMRTGYYGFKSREALARAYCEFHNLLR